MDYRKYGDTVYIRVDKGDEIIGCILDVCKKEHISSAIYSGISGRIMPVEASDFSAKSALFLPKEAQYEYLVNLPDNIAAAGLVNKDGHPMNSLGEVVNNAMQLIEDQSEQLTGVLPKSYTDFSDELLAELLRIFNNSALDDVGGDIIGRIYEYFLNKFAKNIASDDGVFFTPKSLVKMILNIIEPKQGVLLENCTTSLIRVAAA